MCIIQGSTLVHGDNIGLVWRKFYSSKRCQFKDHESVLGVQDTESLSALQEYIAALSHPDTGIPCQELVSGIKIFTGSSAAHWFIKNMEGVSSMQNAQVVGQRLISLGAFIEIQGGTTFVVSSTAYYQFCVTSQSRKVQMDQDKRQVRSQSLGSFSHRVPPSAYQGLSRFAKF
ncbi:hypothetical protein GBAR_LOCUS18723 [Geodia barretti]|uniref:DEP domain-containing protein n=1 Tax=Geodia barretti TaxID=519541 RepID=A0AA35X0E8_GEOBA|nr:hypothetical protein GBAR_LOCUS18723 [Geodia barretti]